MCTVYRVLVKHDLFGWIVAEDDLTELQALSLYDDLCADECGSTDTVHVQYSDDLAFWYDHEF
jgi:hypothetical protein